jgi:DNA mismatch repair protein MSH4
MADIDKMLSGLVSVPKTHSSRTARRSIDTLIYVKDNLKSCHCLADELLALSSKVDPANANCRALLETIITIISSTSCQAIQHIVDEILSEATVFSKSQHEMRHQECFAVRNGKDGELDVARKAHLQTVEDIYAVS